MRLIRAEIRNFKLLEDIRLSFSIDPMKPLTVVRAENGSGKTSFSTPYFGLFMAWRAYPLMPRTFVLPPLRLLPGSPSTFQRWWSLITRVIW